MDDPASTQAGSLVRAASPLAGSFSPGGEEGRPRRRSGRVAAVAGLVLSVLWLAGFASIFAVLLCTLALCSGRIGRTYRLVAAAGLLLGVAGLVLAGVMALSIGVETL